MNPRMKLREILHTASAAAALVCLLPAANALAASPADDVPKETVKFQDLNLQTPAGVEALYKRIHAAAQHVCDAHDSSPFAMTRERECIGKAEARAVMEVNVPALSAYYRQKLGYPVESRLAARTR